MTCSICGECLLIGELVTFQLPGGARIQVCDTCAPRINGDVVEPVLQEVEVTVDG